MGFQSSAADTSGQAGGADDEGGERTSDLGMDDFLSEVSAQKQKQQMMEEEPEVDVGDVDVGDVSFTAAF